MLVSYFLKCHSTWVCLIDLLMIRLGWWVFRRIITEVTCSSHQKTSEDMSWLLSDNVNLDHLVKAVLGFSIHLVFFFFVYSSLEVRHKSAYSRWRELTFTSWRRSYLNYLGFFCRKDLFGPSLKLHTYILSFSFYNNPIRTIAIPTGDTAS